MFSLPMSGEGSGAPQCDVATTPEIDALLAADAPVAIGVSGGKDSTAVSFATVEHLNAIGHRGPRLLVHADLGEVEWADSMPTCERLAKALALELLVVRRKQGGMMQRWEQRWRDNIRRYEALECVQLILPWSTPDMRYCTSELKIDQITRELCRRFPGRTIVNVTGVRRSESNERQNAPISKPQPKLVRTPRSGPHTSGFDWNPIALWQLDDVWAAHDRYGFPRHEVYTVFGGRRVSCVACILATAADHRVAASDPRNVPVLRRMADLEIVSTFAFQGARWLADTLNDILTDAQRTGLERAKERATQRASAEKKIPEHLLYTKGWPTCVPTEDEAILLAAVRFAVADAVGLRKTFTRPAEIIARYEELVAEKSRREARAKNRCKRAAA